MDALATETDTPRRTLGNYLSGRNEPKLSFLMAVCDRYGVELNWLVNGEELAVVTPAAPLQLDQELMGRVTDAIVRLYKEERVALAPVDLGRLAARKYAEIVAATDQADERLAMVKLVTAQLRMELRAAAAEPGTGKASA
ncbi:helix-turn-helix transcriptional regulator [Xanthobacter sp. 126]|uniref:helix-turn-helix domain-containing protein n=1 Tax=Xanthobacter sp. 126 TaxID=1131814 RepID=UPI0018CBF3D0|nr:helix-turn-helix transcriptional regulator [Xanthobacter sp. 126]